MDSAAEAGPGQAEPEGATPTGNAPLYDVHVPQGVAAEAPPAGVEDARTASRGPPAAPEPRAVRKVAVFIAHGMGQQIPFQTLDQVAEGLRKEGEARLRRPLKSAVRSVRFGEQWLNRIELTFEGGGPRTEAHIYEGYWAPLTEGKIDTRGVIRFLVEAGRNGIRNGSEGFQRWIFGCYWLFPSPVRIVLYLLIALLTVGALVVMNSTIVVVAAGRALLGQRPEWLSDGLLADLTTTFNAVIVAFVLFGACLLAAMRLRRGRAPAGIRRAWGVVTVISLAVTLFAVILAGASLAMLLYAHVRLSPGPDARLWHRIFTVDAVDLFDRGFDLLAIALLGVAGGALVLHRLFRVARAVWRDRKRKEGHWLTVLSSGFLVTTLAAAGLLAWSLLRRESEMGGAAGLESGLLSWPLLIAASAYIRLVLVQYVGDVAIYVTPYTLDAYYELRDQIKKCVQTTARAVYALPRADGPGLEYDQVIAVGHSLGSVIVYDVLNRLINDDDAAGRPLDVVGRTPLLLTFGSPLDKTAFIFAAQRQHTTEAREALAASVQPLIRDYSLRPERWINIYSPWDIISGSLGFYDPPEGSIGKRVDNVPDPDATTLLAAHVEYWENPLLFRTLYGALEGKQE